MVSTVDESWATNPIVKPPSLTWQSLTVPDDHDDNRGGESSQPWHSSAQGSKQGSKQGSQKQPHSQQPFHASNTSSFQGSQSLVMNYNTNGTNNNDVDNNHASQSSQQPRPGRRGSLVLKNLKNMLRTTSNKSDKDNNDNNDHPKGTEHEEAAATIAAAAAIEDEKPSLSMDHPELPPLSPRKKTLKERFTIRRPSMLPSPQFNPDEPYPHLDQILPEIVDGTDSGSSPVVAAVPAGVGVVDSMVGNTGSATGSLEDITAATSLTTPPPDLAPASPAKKKKNKLLRPFMSSLPRRSESFPIRPSQQKDKMARRQARQDILGRIGGALGEPVQLNRSGTSSGESGAFLVDAVDGTSGELVLATTTPLANHPTTTNHHDSLVLDASERTTGSGGRFARVRAMVKRTSIFQGRSKTDTAPLVMLDDPSSEFSMELQPDAGGGGEDESSHHDDLEEEDETERDIPKPPELPRPSLENQQANQLPYPTHRNPESMEEDDDKVDDMPSDPKVEHSITERRRVRRQHQHRPSGTSPAPNNSSQGHSDVTNKNSPRRGRIGGRRQSRSHPDEEHNKGEPHHQSPSSLHRRLRPRNSRSNPTQDSHTSEQHQRRMSKDEPQTPSRRRTRKVVDTKSSNPRSDEMDRTKDDHDEDVVAAALDDSSVGDPQTPTRRRLRRHDPNANSTTSTANNNNNNSTTPTTSSKSKSTKERENDQQDRKNPSLGDSESSSRRNSPDPLTVRRRLKQQSSSGSRNNHPEDDPHTGSNNNNNKSSTKHAGSRDYTGSRRSENSPTRNRDHNIRRSLSPPKPGEQPDSDRSSKPPSRERSKEGRSRQRRKSPIKQVGSSQTSQSESQDRRDKRSKSPQKDDRRSKSPVPKDNGQDDPSRNETIPSTSSPNNDDQATQTAPEKTQENGVETSRSRQRSGSPGRAHGRSPTNLNETEASSSRAKGSHRRGRSRDKTIPQRHTSEIEPRSEAMTNEAGSERRRKTKSLSPNSSGDHEVPRRREDGRGELKQQQERSRPSPSSIPENPTPQQPTRVNSYDPSRHRQGSDDRSPISAAVDQNYHKGQSDPSRGRRPQNHHHRRSHHPDDRSVASAGVRRHVGRHPQVETVSELAAKLDALQRS